MSYGLIQETYTASLTTTASTVFKENVTNVEFLMIEVDLVGSPLTSFTIQMKGHASSVPKDMFSASADYTNPVGLLRGASCDMTTLNDSGWVMLDTRGISEVALKATSASTTTLTARVGG